MVEHQHRLSSADEPRVGDVAAPVVDVVLLSNDEKLLAILREASSAHHALWQAATPDAAIELLVGGRCGILIADLALLHTDTLQLFERLQNQFPELIILATGRGDEEVAVASAISSGRIFRFLHKPVSPARASLFLGTATRRYGELRQINALALATLRQNARRPASNKLHWRVAAIAVVGAIALWLTIDRKSERVTSTSTQSPADDYLTRAQAAFRRDNLSGESQDNALSLYRAALNADPGNEEARSGVDRVMNALDKRAVAALRRGDEVAATTAIDQLQRAHPGHSHLGNLQRQLQTLSAQLAASSARQTRAATAAPVVVAGTPAVNTTSTPPASTASTPEAAMGRDTSSAMGPNTATISSRPAPTPQIDRARARLAASQLIAPVDDSAAAYLRRARDSGEDETRLKIAATDLGSRLLDQSREALGTGNLDESQSDFDAAAALDKEFELGLPELDNLRRQLNSKRNALLPGVPALTLQTDVQAAATGAPSSAKVSASQREGAKTADITPALSLPVTAAPLISDDVVPAADLPRTREVAASYPPRAAADGVEGWVDIDFNIAADGTPRDLVVRAARPRNVFDRAALDSLRQWQFVPVTNNGAPIIQRATLRVRFTLK